MSIDALRWAFQQQNLRSTQKLVLIALADRANEINECFPSIKQLVFDTCLNKETICQATEILQTLGIIEKKRRFNKSIVYKLIGVPDRCGPPADPETGAQYSGKPEFRKTGLQYSGKPETNPHLTPIKINPPTPLKKGGVIKNKKRSKSTRDRTIEEDLTDRSWAEH